MSLSIYIFNIKVRYSWILWKIFVNRTNICQITLFANMNNIYEMKTCQIGIGIYLWLKYQWKDLWQIYSQTIHQLVFANRELFAEHCATGKAFHCTAHTAVLEGEWEESLEIGGFLRACLIYISLGPSIGCLALVLYQSYL